MVRSRNISILLNIITSSVLVLSNVSPVLADSLTPDVFITEVQTGNTTASQEFIELYNSSDVDIDLADTHGTQGFTWKLQQYSSTKVASPTFTWATSDIASTISLTGTIAAHGFYLLASTGYLPGGITPDQTYSDRLANTGGGLRLVSVATSDKSVTAHDQVAWLTVVTGGLLPAGFYAPHTVYGSLQRQMNEDDTYLDDEGNLVGFSDSDSTLVTPKAAWQVLPPDPDPADEPPVDNPAPPDDPPVVAPVDDTPPVVLPTEEQVVDEPAPPEVVLLPPQITELLPNPAAPATDDSDEFVELYNPNDQVLDLIGYTLETGLKDSYHFDLSSLTIPAGSYVVVTSGGSTLSLANTGGHARLLNAEGIVISQTDDYADAPEGQSWALINGAWYWTTTPTSMQPNVLTTPIPIIKKAALAKVAKTTTKKVTAVKGASTTKKAAVKTTKAAKKPIAAASKIPAAADIVPPVHTSILVAAGVLAVVYAGYEYRTDIANRIYQLRQHRAHRRAARTSAQGR